MLQQQVEELFDHPPGKYSRKHRAVFQAFKEELNAGRVRAAEPDGASASGWRVNGWVKKGILLGFRMSGIVAMTKRSMPAQQKFFDKPTYPLKRLTVASGVRIVPGGTSVRDACYVAKGVTIIPPTFVNVGTYVDEGTMLDSHALIGSCAQIGKRCHISAAAQIGGVLEPVGAMPVIIEDDVMVGGNSGVYEGTIVKRGAALGTGTILNRSTPVYDVVRDAIYTASETQPLIIPENAVVVPGSRPIARGKGKEWGLALYAAVIVKYRDEKTDLRTQLEELLR